MDRDVAQLVEKTRACFEGVYERAFRGDPAANPRLKVEVVEASRVDDVITMVLITPWTLNGMIFLPDERFANKLTVGVNTLRVFSHELDELGPYRSVNLISDVSGLPSPEEARKAARTLAGPFRDAVANARSETTVADPSRRQMFRRFVAGTDTSRPI